MTNMLGTYQNYMLPRSLCNTYSNGHKTQMKKRIIKKTLSDRSYEVNIGGKHTGA